ncbi:MAG: Calx-beta domain-containing protein [Planctomycetota bacterium]
MPSQRSGSKRYQKRVRRRRRPLAAQLLETRRVLAGFEVAFEFIPSGGGAAVDTLVQGEDYTLRGFVRDGRTGAGQPTGIDRAYFDVLFDDDLVDFSSPITLGERFQPLTGGTSVGTLIEDRIDDIGGRERTAFDGQDPGDSHLLFELPVLAVAAGTLDLDVTLSGTANLISRFNSDLTPITDFDVSGDVIPIVGGGVDLSGIDDLAVTEGGNTDSFTAVLTRQPSADVSLSITPNLANTVSLSQATVTFTTANWDTPQTITVTALEDDIAAGERTIQLVTSDVSSADNAYDGLSVPDPSVTVTDDDTSGVTVNPTFGLFVDEAGTTRDVQVRLQSEPVATVTISYMSGDTDEVTVSPASLVFDASNWDQEQTITLTGVADGVLDLDQLVDVTGSITTNDPSYAALSVPVLSVTNTNEDVAQLFVQPNVGLRTTESGGQDSFTVRLSHAPAADVVLTVTSNDLTEGIVSVGQLTFNSGNFDQTQAVTITGVDDDLTDGDVAFTVTVEPAAGSDPAFAALSPVIVMATNEDEDIPGLIVAAPTQNQTTEGGGSVTGTVRLSTEPSQNVIVTVSSNATDEGTVAQGTLTFTPDNWDQPQNYEVVGVDDAIDDGDQSYQVRFASMSSDTDYQGLDAGPVLLTNVDDDTAALVIADAGNLQTDESGQSDLFSVRLATEPVGTVTLSIASNDTGEVTVSTTQLAFDASNWMTPQSITVAGVDDAVIDGPVLVSVTVDASTSEDGVYRGLAATSVQVENLDDDASGVVFIGVDDLNVAEDGSTDQFQVRLSNAPTDDVTVTLVSQDLGEAAVSASELTFNEQNWDTPQTVVITGVADNRVDGDVVVTITASVESNDDSFSDLTLPDVQVTNANTDTAVLSVGNLIVDESVGTASLDVLLTSDVEGGLTLDFATTDDTAVAGSDYTTATGRLTFSGNDGESQSISLDITDDSSVEIAETLFLTLSNLSGNGIDVNDVTLNNANPTVQITDDDTASLRFVPSSVTLAEGDEGETPTANFEVELVGEVQNGLTVSYSTTDGTASSADNDYVAAAATLSFAGTNGERQAIAVSILGDTNPEATETFSLGLVDLLGVPVAIADSVSLPSSDASITIRNDDIPQLLIRNVTPSSSEGDDGTTTFVFEVELTEAVDQPGGFTVDYTTVDGTATVADGDYQATTGQLSFDGDRQQVQTISVLVGGDQKVEVAEQFQLQITPPSVLVDGGQLRVDRTQLDAVISNDDVANITLSASSDAIEESDGSGNANSITLTATLDAEVDGGFSVDLETANGTAVAGSDFVAASMTLNFQGMIDESLEVSVDLIDDDLVERGESFFASLLNIGDNMDEILQDIRLPVSATEIDIENEDRATISLGGDVGLSEGAAGDGTNASLAVSLSDPVDATVIVSADVDNGTAVSGDDFNDAIANATFGAGTTDAQSFVVSIVGDAVVEFDEVFSLGLDQLVAVDQELADFIDLDSSRRFITIENDDVATLSLAGPSNVPEAGGAGIQTAANYQVTLSAPVSSTLQIDVASVADTATAGSDFSNVSQTLTFTPGGSLTQSFSVPILGDGEIESEEAFQAAASNLRVSDGDAGLLDALTLTTDTVVTRITDDDSIRVEFSTGASSVAESSGTHTVLAGLVATGGAALTQALLVDVALIAGTAGTDDATLTTTQIQFPAGSGDGAEASVTLDLTDDGLLESDETFSLQLSTSNGDVSVDDTGHVVTITDDPQDATIRGTAFVDTNANGQIDSVELRLAGITIELSGTDGQGNLIERSTTTDADGNYEFTALPGGTYTLRQIQPATYRDAAALVGRVNEAGAGVVDSNAIRDIVIPASGSAEGFHFSEAGLTIEHIDRRLFNARYDASVVGQGSQDSTATDIVLSRWFA